MEHQVSSRQFFIVYIILSPTYVQVAGWLHQFEYRVKAQY